MSRSLTKANSLGMKSCSEKKDGSSIKSLLGNFVFASIALMSSRCCEATVMTAKEPYLNYQDTADFYLIEFKMEYIPATGEPHITQ